ncbi:hypothetical protein NBRC3293_0323 [Gluconobacter oxydans NBRC 3293]|uniref:Uncharacterized protein n=1 Tax=Gluconobacter oxydans NBRC 3293 TaxID=1315969 RepID=A0A829WYV0_GLUOY|nr:hypothetical protein NBRC3293_0323 [Gluconobacter oxydans NBRC 3293]
MFHERFENSMPALVPESCAGGSEAKHDIGIQKRAFFA